MDGHSLGTKRQVPPDPSRILELSEQSVWALARLRRRFPPVHSGFRAIADWYGSEKWTVSKLVPDAHSLGALLAPSHAPKVDGSKPRIVPRPGTSKVLLDEKTPETTSFFRELAARPERFELPTFGSVDRRSIQLSYGRVEAD